MRRLPLAAISAALALQACSPATTRGSGQTPPSPLLSLTPARADVVAGEPITLRALRNGAAVAVRWSDDGGGSFSPSSAGTTATDTVVYTAPGTARVVTITGRDPTGNEAATATLNVTAPVLRLTPASAAVAPSGNTTFQARRGGIAVPVRWSDGGGGGTFTPATAGSSAVASVVYTAPATPETVTISAVDPVSQETARATLVVGTVGRYAAMIGPVNGETFTSTATAPAMLRFFAAGRDPNVDTNSPSDGLGGNAASVQFYVDDTLALEVQGSEAEYWIFKGFPASALSLAPGTHNVWARASYVNPTQTIDSAPVVVSVTAPTYAQTVDLGGDLAITGAHAWVGTPAARIRVNGHGHRITGVSTGAISWRHVDFYDVGDPADTSQAGIDVSTSGSLELQGCSFEWSNPVQLAVTGAAPATIRENVFHSNMRQPIGQYPSHQARGTWSAVVLKGSSTGAKVFAANTVGAGGVDLDGTSGWVVGGDAATDGNVSIGPRVGYWILSGASNITLKRNYSHHIYFGGWSQGSNFELGGSASVTAEHNVIAGSSWPVRGVGGEFRYNLVLQAGHQWLWADHPDGFIHHNVFVGGELDQSGIQLGYAAATGVRIQNNTIDGLGGTRIGAGMWQSAGSSTFTSNLLVNVTNAPVSVTGGTMAADYNLFWSSGTPSYSDSRAPSHDVHADPRLANALTTVYGVNEPDAWSRTYDIDEVALWTRSGSTTASSVLAAYRARYAPGAGSPALDAGDPGAAPASFGAGNDIGAIGGGTANPFDLFGK